MIKVVGLGLNSSDVSARGKKAIAGAEILVAKSRKAKQANFLPECKSYDEYYETATDFDELDKMIVDDLAKLSLKGEICYCVLGDGYKDNTVIELTKLGLIEEIIACGEFSLPSNGALDITATFFTQKNFCYDTIFALKISQVDSEYLASEVKLKLLDKYNYDTQCYFFVGGKVEKILLEDIDRQKKYDYSTTICIEGQESFDKAMYCEGDLYRIISRLTASDGCEWDKAQTHKSIRRNCIEEAYEVVNAIDNDDIDNMIEEFGDLILQSVLNSDIALRTGEFTLSEVYDRLCKKLVSRHTHIFGEDKALSSSEALAFWEKAKLKEKGGKQVKLDIPESFPATLRLMKIVKKLRKSGKLAKPRNSDKRDDSELVRALMGVIDSGEDIEVAINELCGRIEKIINSDKASALSEINDDSASKIADILKGV